VGAERGLFTARSLNKPIIFAMPLITLVAALLATLSGFNQAAPLHSAQMGGGSECGGGAIAVGSAVDTAAAWLGRDWSAKAEDNICGLRDLAQVSSPVVIDFQACLDATPEMKKIKAEKIDPKSPDGIRLTTEATNRVTQACESVQKANGYCSVWKAIKHKDGRAVTDISSQVTSQF
jgi:hypothetical protein